MLLAPIGYIIKWIYFVLPAAALAVAIFGAKRWRNVPGAVIVAFVAGLGVAVTLNLAYATLELNPRPQSAHTLPAALAGRITLGQIALAAYFACGMFLLLRLFDAGLQWVTTRTFALQRQEVTRLRRARVLLATMTRVCLLFGIGLPYVMASVMIYRPRAAPTDNPRTQLGFNFEPVGFVTSDGMKISGWWIPAQEPPQRSRRAGDAAWGTQTALICHGFASSKSNQLILARRLVPAGYNCLAIDFRAHGQSSGQLTTFGATEKRDVLAAIRWLKENHPHESQRIVGVGASMGAAALISAAADDSPEGRAIAAIACYAGYDDLREMTRSAADNFFAPPLSWLTFYVGLPMAEAQAGCDLAHYAPARDAAALWPRPILLLHAERDELIDFDRGQALLDAANQPKYHVWFSAGSHNDLLKDDAAAKIVLEFFRTAKSVPVI